MFLQIGDIIFDKAYTPEGLTHSDETAYAEHALLSIKPRLQPMANNLEELSFTLKLRAEILDITSLLLALKKAKDEYEVMPVIMGTGQYKGDYVITSLEDETVSSLPDGTPIEMNLTVSLKEYLIADKLQQQQNAARKQAFAVGDKKPVHAITEQEKTQGATASEQLSIAESHAGLANSDIRSYSNNVSQQSSIAQTLQYRFGVMDTMLNRASDTISGIQGLSSGPAIVAAIANVRAVLQQFVFPIPSTTILNNNNTDLQAAVAGLNNIRTSLTNLVITRSL